jgi:hypothetical protein
MTAEQKVLQVLSDEWKSTNSVAKEAGINWYRTERILYNLLNRKIVELDTKPDTKYWRLNKGANGSGGGA